jgi:hypothetical protein
VGCPSRFEETQRDCARDQARLADLSEVDGSSALRSFVVEERFDYPRAARYWTALFQDDGSKAFEPALTAPKITRTTRDAVNILATSLLRGEMGQSN